ncbi:RHS repeat-associated core domain-containing protein [Streptomyces sp. NPDC004237]|uniref:RHS repeat-associated core domain-containing protein n=1 Tax=Streptomyces sp. NPDC004237 TaxID=3154455 RepID=UPI0033AACEF0
MTSLDRQTENYGYDSSGRLNTVTNARKKRVTYNEYDAQGRVTLQTDALDHTTKFAYSKNGVFDQVDVTAPDQGVWTDIYYKNVLFTQIDPLNNKSYYRYDKFFNRTSEIDAEIRETQWTFDSQGRMTARSNTASDESWTYDSNGNIGTYTDGEYNKYTYGYNAANQLTSVKDPLTKTTAYGYNPTTALLETVTTPRLKTTHYGYDTDGNLASVTTPKGNKTTYTYDAYERVRTVVDPRGNVTRADPTKYTTTYTYDDADRVKSVTNARKYTTAYGYDEVGNLTSVTDAKQRTTVYGYSDANRLTSITDPAQKQTFLGYDPAGRLNKETNRLNATVTYQYDKAGNQTQVVSARGNVDGADASKYTWLIGYDKVGNRKTVTDPLKKTTAFSWDADNRPLSVTDPLNHTRKVTYDDNGSLLTTSDGLGHGTTLSYDDDNRLSSSKTWLGYVTSYEYDDDSHLSAETTPESERTSYGYDDGNLASTVDPRGNVDGADPAAYTWKYGYDEAGNPTSVTDPLGHTHTTGYDEVGNIASVTDALNKSTVYEYDELNRLTKVTAPDTGPTSFTYNAAGFLDTSTDGNTHTTVYGYNAEGQLTSVKNPLSKTVSYEYDVDGNRTKYTNARTQTITTTVDARNLPTKIAYSDGTPTESYGYDDASRLTSVTDATGSRTLTYDDDDKILSITSPGATKPFSYAWNTNDTLKSRTYPDGRATSYTYDKVGRTKTQTTNSKAVTYDYDKAGNLTSVALPTTSALSETRTYDEAGRLTHMTRPTGDSTYFYDANDRVTFASGTAIYRYAYDDAGRLTASCKLAFSTCLTSAADADTHYTYDKAGNLTSSGADTAPTTYFYNAADQLTSTSLSGVTTSYSYDADGNQTKDDDGTYAYDAANRVKSATIGSNSYAFTNDADGNWTITNKNGALNRTSRWDVESDLPQIATDTDSAGALIADYHYDPDGTARSMDRTAGTYYFTQDRQKSVSGVYDAAGTDNYQYTYSPWGVSTGTATVTGGQTSIFGYTGQYKDPVLPDRLQLRARSYDTTQQRFTTQDPVGAAADNPNQSAYNYADNDPTDLSDPSGNCPMCIGAAIGAVVSGGVYALTHQDDFDWGDFAAATAEGAVVGAVGGFLAPAGASLATQLGLQGGRALAVTAVTDAAIGAGLTWAINTAQCRPTSATDLLVGALTGALADLVAPAWGALKTGFKGLLAPKVTVHAYTPGHGAGTTGGTGAGPTDDPIRYAGPWTRADIGRGSRGLSPQRLGNGRIEIHHADQMPGSGVHELERNRHRGAGTDLHRNRWKQGVTKDMRTTDTRLHWWYRSQEHGWGVYDPRTWFDNWED